jgi:hypothetical protein
VERATAANQSKSSSVCCMDLEHCLQRLHLEPTWSLLTCRVRSPERERSVEADAIPWEATDKIVPSINMVSAVGDNIVPSTHMVSAVGVW